MSTHSKKRDVTNLEKYKRDISDDSGEINAINKLVSNLKADFQDFLSSDKTNSIVRKMDHLTETNQQSDSDLVNASNYITREINELNKEITAETAAAKAAAQTRAVMYGNSTGGGGAW